MVRFLVSHSDFAVRVVAIFFIYAIKKTRTGESGIHRLDSVEISSNALLWVQNLPFHDP